MGVFSLYPHAKRNHLLLDAGCGGGLISIPYCQAGGKAIAIDIGPGFVEYARERAEILGVGGRVNFMVGDICDLCLKSEIFDVISCTEVLEHLPKPSKAIAEFERVLRPGGILVITVPNPIAVSFSLHGAKRLPKTLLSLAFRRLLGNRTEVIEFSPTASEKYGIRPTVYKHTEFAPFELENMLPANFKVLKSLSIVYPLSKYVNNERNNFEISRLIQKVPFLNMIGIYSFLLATKLGDVSDFTNNGGARVRS